MKFVALYSSFEVYVIHFSTLMIPFDLPAECSAIQHEVGVIIALSNYILSSRRQRLIHHIDSPHRSLASARWGNIYTLCGKPHFTESFFETMWGEMIVCLCHSKEFFDRSLKLRFLSPALWKAHLWFLDWTDHMIQHLKVEKLFTLILFFGDRALGNDFIKSIEVSNKIILWLD